jgi:glycerol-3-phosphate dehydrogenase
MLSKKLTSQRLPSLSTVDLTGGIVYQDGQFDDARLAINLAQTAADQGACLVNYCKLVSFQKTGKRITGAVLQDELSGKTYQVHCSCVVNATGIFTDNVMKLDNENHEPMIALSQGAHVVVAREFFAGEEAMMIPKTDDGRVLFAVPWHDKVLLGTTDTPVDEITLEPRPLEVEVSFIIRHINRYLTTNIQYKDIKSVFAGLRPLVKVKGKNMTSILPRDHTTIVSASGLVTITGGKWTTYRKMGKHAIDNAAFAAKLGMRPCVTESLRLHGFTQDPGKDDQLSVYGSDAPHIRNLVNETPALQHTIHPAFTYSRACVVWAVTHEMAMTAEDILARRTRALFLDARAAIEAAPIVAEIMAGIMKKDKEWEKAQVAAFTAVAERYLIQ